MTGKNYIKTSLTGAEDLNLPLVALVGRPNVGKSTLFNRLTRSRRAIIDPKPGMTRDRLYGSIHGERGSFRLVDTGGLDDSPDTIVSMIRGQTNRAIEEADLVILMVDGRAGMNAADEDIALALRQSGKPLVLFVNKMEDRGEESYDTTVYQLGFETTLFGSAEHGRGMDDLLEAVEKGLSGKLREPKKDQESDLLRLAVIGRPNVGKSSFVNKLIREERVMVSDIPGTTRDPIDSFFTYRKRTICLVDTAGIRKRGSIAGSQESLSVMMARRQVGDADVIALLIDAIDPSTGQDAAIAGIADKAGKPVVVVVNKWDLIEGKSNSSTREFEEKIRRRLKFLETSPFVFISAKTGQRVTRVLDLALDLKARMSGRVTTGVLNRFVADIAENHRLPNHKGKRLRVLYMTQVSTAPPTFIAMINLRKGLYFSQERFLINRIREEFGLAGIPIRLIIKPRTEKKP